MSGHPSVAMATWARPCMVVAAAALLLLFVVAEVLSIGEAADSASVVRWGCVLGASAVARYDHATPRGQQQTDGDGESVDRRGSPRLASVDDDTNSRFGFRLHDLLLAVQRDGTTSDVRQRAGRAADRLTMRLAQLHEQLRQEQRQGQGQGGQRQRQRQQQRQSLTEAPAWYHWTP